MGYREYEALSREFRVPIVVGGFEPLDLLEAISMLVAQLEDGRAEVENQYARSVCYEGNLPAQRIMAEVFEVCDRKWRGIGPDPGERPAPAGGVRRVRRRAGIRVVGDGGGRTGRVHQRPGAARAEEARRLPGLRRPARRRTRWARPWSLPKAPAPLIINTAGTPSKHRGEPPWAASMKPSRSSVVRPRCPLKTKCCWATGAAASSRRSLTSWLDSLQIAAGCTLVMPPQDSAWEVAYPSTGPWCCGWLDFGVKGRFPSPIRLNAGNDALPWRVSFARYRDPCGKAHLWSKGGNIQQGKQSGDHHCAKSGHLYMPRNRKDTSTSQSEYCAMLDPFRTSRTGKSRRDSPHRR